MCAGRQCWLGLPRVAWQEASALEEAPQGPPSLSLLKVGRPRRLQPVLSHGLSLFFISEIPVHFCHSGGGLLPARPVLTPPPAVWGER